MIQVDWTTIKTLAVAKLLPLQYVETTAQYQIYVVDNGFALFCILDKNPSDTTDKTDFENNFKVTANTSMNQLDADGAFIVRPKAAKRGWSFWAVPIEITTSAIGGSVYAKDASGTDIPGITCKIYDGSNNEITTPGVLNANLNTCVKTVLDFEPAFDFEMIGGALRIHNNPGSDVRMWIIGAPDIPAIYGGSKEFASGVNLKFLAPDNSFEIDGRVSKYVTYNPTTHSGKLRIILKHSAGLSLNIQVLIHVYRL